jgi:PAS domain S-box-containing protein
MEGDDLLLWPGDDGSASSVRRESPASFRVLIIEDTPDHAELIWVMLAHARGPRWTSTTVGTLSEARAWLRENHADVALLDLNLPDSRGPQTAGLLCREYPELPVVIYTSLTDESVALAALQQGAQEHLVKGQFEGALLSRTLRLAVERKRAELAQARLAAIVENSSDAIIGATLYGIIVAWNAGATSVYGCSAADAVGRSIEILVQPERPEEMRSILHRLRRGEHVDSFETKILRKDGRALDILLTVSPVRDAAGRVNGVSAIARDITEVKRAREELREREEEFRLLFQRNPQPMWVSDAETGSFLEVNEAAVEHYGYSRDEFLGLRIEDIRPPQDAQGPGNALAEGTPSFRTANWRHVKRDGQVIDVEVTGHDISFGGRRACLVVTQDVTERNHLRAQRLQSQQMEAVGRRAGSLAHDLNNVLGVITGYTALLKKGLKDARAQARADEVLKAAERASALTRELLALSGQDVLPPKVRL